MGGCPLALPWKPQRRTHFVNRRLQPSQQVGAMTVVGPLATGYHRGAPSMVGMALRQVGPIDPPEVALRP